MNPWKVILATVIIFAAGVLTGAFVTKRAQRPERSMPFPQLGGPVRPQQDFVPTPWFARREFLDRMDRHLKLNAEQYDSISKIVQESQERTRAIVGRVKPDLQEELKRVRREIRGQLTPEQTTQFEELERIMRRSPRPPMDGPPDGRRPRRDGPPPNQPPPAADGP